MSMGARRVTDAVLLEWLDRAPDKLERYLQTVPDAASRMESLTALGAEAAEQLAESFSPDADFAERMLQLVSPSPDSAQMTGLVFGMLTLAWQTLSSLADPDRSWETEA
jgi:hypothetical protein